MQDPLFSEEKSPEPPKIYSAVVEYKARQVLNKNIIYQASRYTHGVNAIRMNAHQIVFKSHLEKERQEWNKRSCSFWEEIERADDLEA